MKICQLESSFDDAERIGEKCADESGYGGGKEVVIGGHLILLELSETCEVDVAAKSSFKATCDKSLIEPFDSILFHNVFAGGD